MALVWYFSSASLHTFYYTILCVYRNLSCIKVNDIEFQIQQSAYKNKAESSQCPEMILDRIDKTFNNTYTGLRSFHQRFQWHGMAVVPNQPYSDRIGCTA